LGFSGGIAGVIAWFLVYPLDVIKTDMQCEKQIQKLSLVSFAKDRYKKHGGSYFYKGLSATMLRTFPVNAIVLTAFDLLNERFSK
jgi:solute carrier family 25 carnitine/acylcarnitine transporter 20/29